MTTKESFQKTLQATYGEIVAKDCYLFKKWKCDFFDYIIDIGASVGVFTNYAHMRHPQAKIIAYEPCKETFEYLTLALQYMRNITYRNEAMGDGSPLTLYDTGWAGCNLFFKETEKKIEESYSIKSTRLSDMFDEHKIPLESKYYIKIDCEGGERFLLKDQKSIDLIKKSCGCAIEIHYPPVGKKVRSSSAERFKLFPAWKVYNTWISDNFNKSHKITYHMSDRRMGHGVYVLESNQHLT